MRKRMIPGFTLAELLIALGILGVIATFTIPKVLQSQQDGKYNSIAKEAASMISEAYTAYKLNNQVSSSFKLTALTPYLNYIKYDTITTVDDLYGSGSVVCVDAVPCLLLHNGARLRFRDNSDLGGTASTNAVWFHVDPDGVYSGTTQGPGKAVALWLYYNGKLTDQGNILANTQNSGGTYNPEPLKTPPWFSW